MKDETNFRVRGAEAVDLVWDIIKIAGFSLFVLGYLTCLLLGVVLIYTILFLLGYAAGAVAVQLGAPEGTQVVLGTVVLTVGLVRGLFQVVAGR